MSMSIITSIAKSDTTKTLKDVRRLKTSLDRERITEKQGFGAFEFVVISDYDKEEFDSVWGNSGNYRFVPVEQEEMHELRLCNVMSLIIYGQVQAIEWSIWTLKCMFKV